MAGHTSWTQVKGQVITRSAWEGLIAFTRGYILACEDIIRDLDHMGSPVAGPRDTTIQVVKMKVTKSMEEAKRTLTVITGDDHGSRS